MKKILSLLMSLVMAASIVATLPASAESYFTNDSIATATPIALNTTYPINYGTDPSYGTDCYVKITLPSNGYVSIAIKRPIVDQQYEDMAIEIINSQGIKITEDYTNLEGASTMNFRTGLKKGTYYVNIVNRFSGYDEPSDVIATFAVGFTATNYCEAEPNDGVVAATPMTFGQAYLGFVEPDASSKDYYKFVVPTTRKVRIYIGKYTSIVSSSGTLTYFDLFKSGDQFETSLIYYKGSNDWNSSIYKFNLANNKIKVLSSGTGYIDKYLTAGTYYIKVSSYLDTNAAYSIGVTNTPAASTVTTTKKKSNKPAQVKKLKLKKGGKKTAKLAWKKVKGAKGYQIKYSTSKKFKKSKTKTKTSKKNKITLKKLNKKRYYVKVRAYKKVKGKKVYGKYSSVLMLYRLW